MLYLLSKLLPLAFLPLGISLILLLEASRIKASHPLSIADAWIAATALLSQATLLHKDPEFEAITQLDKSWLA